MGGCIVMLICSSVAQRKTVAFAKKTRGASLIEVLVAILLVSFGLVAMTGMQLYSVGASKNAVNRGIAVGLVNEILDSMRANPAGVTARSYEQASNFDKDTFAQIDASATSPCSYPSCTAANVAARDLAFFQQRVRSVLPAGGFKLQILGGAAVTAQQADVWIMWVEAGFVETKNAAGTNSATEANLDDCPSESGTRVTGARCLRMRVNI
jgi:type IV pilus assembly protein PilV